MPRIDLAATIERISHPEETWRWLDLIEDLIEFTQAACLKADKGGFKADTPHRKFLVAQIQNVTNQFRAIYMLLRMELVHQAAAQVRLLCENTITLFYVSEDPDKRASQFWDYAYIEAYERGSAFLDWEAATADPAVVTNMETKLARLRPEYEQRKSQFQFTDRRGKTRSFANWANLSIAAQAEQLGVELAKLYQLAYKTMSSYVHGSGWSLRKQGAYSIVAHDPEIVLVDMTNVIRTAIAIWIHFARFCDQHLGWHLSDSVAEFVERVNRLDADYVAKRSGVPTD